jgi:hypothetical protein
MPRRYTNAYQLACRELDNRPKPGPKKGSHYKRFVGPEWNAATHDPIDFYKPTAIDLIRYPEKWRWPIAHLLDLIHYKNFSRYKWLEPLYRFVRLKARYLTKVIPSKRLQKIKRRLVEDGVIEIDNDVWPGQQCKGYRLTPEYRSTHLLTCTDDDFCRKVYRVRHRHDDNLQPVHRWLLRNLERVTIDMDDAKEIVAELSPKKKKRKVPYTTAEYRNALLESCGLIHGTRKIDQVCKQGRVHTVVGRLKRELVPCLRTTDGERLVWIDAANSQPLIAGMVALRYYSASRWSRKRLIKETESGAAKGTDQRKAFSPYQSANQAMCALNALKTAEGKERESRERGTTTGNFKPLSPDGAKELRNRMAAPTDSDLQDVLKWVGLTEAGSIYRFLMTKKQRARAKKDKEFAARFKVAVLKVMYKANNKNCRGRLELRMRRLFPSIMAMLDDVKRKDHGRAARIMQTYESTLFVHRISGRIMRERPGTLVVTKHDAIGTTPDAKAYVLAITREEFAKVGLNPTLHGE